MVVRALRDEARLHAREANALHEIGRTVLRDIYVAWANDHRQLAERVRVAAGLSDELLPAKGAAV